MGKTWWKSKTLWVNLIAAGVFIVQMVTGFVVDVEAQAGLLAVINVILRLITREPLDWSKPEDGGQGIGRIVPLILVVIVLSGCATLKQDTPEALATKSLLGMKEVIVASARVGGGLCRQGVIEADRCRSIESYYLEAGPVYDLAADSLITAVKVRSAESWDRYRVAQEQFILLFSAYMNLAAEYGLLAQPVGGAQ